MTLGRGVYWDNTDFPRNVGQDCPGFSAVPSPSTHPAGRNENKTLNTEEQEEAEDSKETVERG